MKFQLLASTLAIASGIFAEALPWANANPHASAAAESYAEAYAEAVAIGHADPEAYALAAAADDCASIACHASCGLLIIQAQDCSQNEENTYAGPYNTTCLCSSGSSFLQYYTPCMDCGWTLWKYYGVYVTSALAACGTLSTEPTGTSRCSTTLTDTYTADFGIDACEYTGGCDDTTSAAESTAKTSSAEATTSSKVTSAAEETSSAAESIAQSTAESTAQSIAQSTAQSIAQSTAESTAESTAQSTAESTAAASTTATISTFSGAAAKIYAAGAAGAVAAFLLM